MLSGLDPLLLLILDSLVGCCGLHIRDYFFCVVVIAASDEHVLLGLVLFDSIESKSHLQMLVGIYAVIARPIESQVIIDVLLPFHVILLLDADICKI